MATTRSRRSPSIKCAKFIRKAAPSPTGANSVLRGVGRLNGVANYFQERCLGGREFRSGINERFTQDDMHALDAITTGIAGGRYSLGYSGLSSTRSGVKALALAEHDGEPAVQPTIE